LPKALTLLHRLVLAVRPHPKRRTAGAQSKGDQPGIAAAHLELGDRGCRAWRVTSVVLGGEQLPVTITPSTTRVPVRGSSYESYSPARTADVNQTIAARAAYSVNHLWLVFCTVARDRAGCAAGWRRLRAGFANRSPRLRKSGSSWPWWSSCWMSSRRWSSRPSYGRDRVVKIAGRPDLWLQLAAHGIDVLSSSARLSASRALPAVRGVRAAGQAA